MKFYLSSYKLGRETDIIKDYVQEIHSPIGYIPNALDFTGADTARRQAHIRADMDDLKQYGAQVELLDLRDYFADRSKLKEKLDRIGGLYVSGGNTFILRQAMSIAGMDSYIKANISRKEFMYIAYSAGAVVLSPDLRPFALVDSAEDMPYPELTRQIWDGLGILDYAYIPHYRSDHPESDLIDRVIEYCQKESLPYKTFRDGDVELIV